jgi:hypothetical protein
MQTSLWRIDGHIAQLETEQLCAEIDLLNPAGGVRVTSAADAALTDATLFRVGLPAAVPTQLKREGNSPAEFFSRGNDLIAIYSERPDHPFRAQIYWRLIAAPFADSDVEELRRIAALELILSIQTSLLDSDPGLEVATELATRKASQLVDPASAHFLDLTASATPTSLGPETGAGCFQVPLADGRLTYIEMIHPADFHRATLASRIPDAPVLRLAHRLFPQRLEKGVILRSRLRGFFAPARIAQSAIAQAYDEFAVSEPPLTV